MQALIGTSWAVFVGLTLVIMGGAAFLTGQAVARTWRPVWQVVLYGVLLGLTDRFLTWGLFAGELLSLSGLLIDAAVLILIGLFAYRITHVATVVSQYPWLYQRTGPLTYRRKPTASAAP